MSSHIKEYLAEMVGTIILLFFGTTSIIIISGNNIFSESFISDDDDGIQILLTGLMFSGTVALIIVSPFGKLSGGHLNPVVSLSFWLLNKMHHRDLLGYIVFQFIGAVIGSALAMLLWTDSFWDVAGGLTVPGPEISVLEAFNAELIMTFVLITAILLMLSHHRTIKFIPLMIWLLIAIEVFVASSISGTSLNPARSFGSAVILNSWSDQWIYFVAPVIGSLMATLMYKKNLFGTLELRTAKLFHTSNYTCIFLQCLEAHIKRA